MLGAPLSESYPWLWSSSAAFAGPFSIQAAANPLSNDRDVPALPLLARPVSKSQSNRGKYSRWSPSQSESPLRRRNPSIMCIALISTAHPDYPLILLNNRDEFLGRPTAPAAFWDPPAAHVLGGRDLHRAARGTWLGATTDGRVAALTNFHEPDPGPPAAVSRGAMAAAFLAPAPADVGTADTAAFVHGLLSGEGARGAGGFSLVCGRVGAPLAVVSNRMRAAEEVGWIGAGVPAVGLSNAAFGDRSWPKVVRGEEALAEVVRRAEAGRWAREKLVGELFGVLSSNAMPPPEAGVSFEEMTHRARESIFLPLIGRDGAVESKEVAADSGLYGTQKQTVVLVDRSMQVTFVERTLYDEEGNGIPSGDGTKTFDFTIIQ